MGNVVRNTIFGMIIALIFNAIVWWLMNMAGVSHQVTTGGIENVALAHVVIRTVIAAILAAIGYLIFRNFAGRTALLIIGAILTVLSLLGPLNGAVDGGYGTYVSLGVMHIITFAAMAYMLLSDRMKEDAA